VKKLSVQDDATPFEVTRLEADDAARLVLFSVGAGGDPERHLPLLQSLADHGCTVVAPHFERLASPIPTLEDLLVRARRLRLALDVAAQPALPVVGVGHSIGAAVLLALAGAAARTIARERVGIVRDDRVGRLALFAPVTDFFRAPRALDELCATIVAWAGTNDTITPPRQAELLKGAPNARVEVRAVDGAGHFSFMNVPPPRTSEPLADRDAFLSQLAEDVCRFALA
jgi:alpha-beta hydrolase superfamily lysophospholipase